MKTKLSIFLLFLSLAVFGQFQQSELNKGLIFHAPLDEWNGSRDLVSGTVGTATAVTPVLDKSGSGRRWVEPATASPFSSHTAIPAFGTGNFSVIRKVKTGTIGTAQSLTGGASGAFDLYISATGYLTVIKFGGTPLTASTTLLTANTEYVLSYIRSGTTTGTYYVNGVAAGTCTDANDYTVGCTLRGAGTGYFLGLDYMTRIFNYALTAQQITNYSKPEYPIEFVDRIVGTVGADVFSGWDFTNWGNISSTTNSATQFTTTGGGGSVRKNSFLLAGKKYQIRLVANNTGISSGITDYGGSVSYTTFGGGAIDKTFTTPITTYSGVLLYGGANGTTMTVSSLTGVQLGCILDLNADGMSSATWIDKTNSITATNSGTTFVLPPASNLKASYFNGSTSKVVGVNKLDNVPVFTIAARALFLKTSGWNTIYSEGLQAASGVMLAFNGGRAAILIPSGAYETVQTSVLNENTWYNVVCIYNGTIATIYVNSINSASGAMTKTTSGGDASVIGSAQAVSGSWETNYFNGLMSYVGIWSRTLTADEIALLNAIQ